MALKLTSGSQIDPRYDGYRTVFGSAFSHFLKIRTERNKVIWKQRLKDASPQTLLKMEGDIQDRIIKLTGHLADMRKSDLSVRQRLVLDAQKEQGKNWRAMLADRQKRDSQQAEFFETAMKSSLAWANIGVPDSATGVMDSAEASMKGSSGTVTQWFANMAASAKGKGPAGGMGPSTEAVKREWRAALRSGASNAESKEKGGGAIAKEKFYMQEYARAANWGAELFKKADPATRRHISYLREILIQETNAHRYGSGGGKDILAEASRLQDVREKATEEGRKILDRGLKMYSPSGGFDMESLKAITGTSPAQDTIKKAIDKLTESLDQMPARKAAAAAEYDYLLRGGGMHMGLDPVSYRPSATGSRIDAFRRMYAAEPKLAEATGAQGAVTFPKGEGGNLSDFLKTRIGMYDSKNHASNLKLMDEIESAVDAYGDRLADADVVFDTSATPVSNQVADLKSLLADWKATKTTASNAAPLATIYLDALKDSKFEITRDHSGLAQQDPQNKQIHEYNARVYPARTNVSVVLNPRIDSILNAYSAGDLETAYNGMTDLYNMVNQPGLDDLLGSAGTNIRGVVEDMHTSAPEIGHQAAMERAVLHLQKTQEDLAEQRVNQDPGELVPEPVE